MLHTPAGISRAPRIVSLTVFAPVPAVVRVVAIVCCLGVRFADG